jgi:hypothetical protein
MPYISKAQRKIVEDIGPSTAGELNFAVTQSLLAYMKRRGVSYTTMNEIIGALECAKIEFYRRVMVDFEQKKCILNGDVYK